VLDTVKTPEDGLSTLEINTFSVHYIRTPTQPNGGAIQAFIPEECAVAEGCSLFPCEELMFASESLMYLHGQHVVSRASQ